MESHVRFLPGMARGPNAPCPIGLRGGRIVETRTRAMLRGGPQNGAGCSNATAHNPAESAAQAESAALADIQPASLGSAIDKNSLRYATPPILACRTMAG